MKDVWKLKIDIYDRLFDTCAVANGIIYANLICQTPFYTTNLIYYKFRLQSSAFHVEFLNKYYNTIYVITLQICDRVSNK